MIKKQYLSEEYFQLYHEYHKKYKDLCILFQVGSFYEMYGISSETSEEKLDISSVSKFSEILNIQQTRKDKSKKPSILNPDYCGFQTISLNKFLPILLNHNYTVILVNEHRKDNKISRKIEKI